MALVTQIFPLTGDYVPYERPSDRAALWTAIPRGLQSFMAATAQVDIKPVNDDFQLSLTATLPPNFAYVMADANFSLTQNRAVDFEDNVNLNLQNFYRGSESATVGLAGNWVQDFIINASTVTARGMQQIAPWPAFPLVAPRGASGILVNFTAWNNQDAAATTGIFDFFISFWQFDLEQIRKFPINTPLPTHNR